MMSERIGTDQLSPRIRRLRKRQVVLAVMGMVAFLTALIGGALQSRVTALGGIGGFLISLVSLLTVGVMSWFSQKSDASEDSASS
jgi:uncharacterized YccA/Bax inhibitor family protein